jgi:polyisoprenoid-binding protein YceI
MIGVMAIPAVVNGQTWDIDRGHSHVGFSVNHLVVSKVRGAFTDFSGSMQFNGQNVASGAVEATVKMESIDTGVPDRDTHLRGADFFAVDSFPNMTFRSKKTVPGKDGEFQLVGDLTLKDVTKEVAFDCEFHGTVQDPWGNTRAGFSGEGIINRQDFHITWSKALDGGGFVVGDEVRIMLEVEAVKAK